MVKGIITIIDGSQITLETKKGGEVIFNLPDDFGPITLIVGDTVIAKCQMLGGELTAEWVKKVGKNSADNEDKAEGRKDNSAYCNADKKQEPHPMAAALAVKYGVEPTWVMDNFCGGYSMGAIMLALKTGDLKDTEEDLEEYANGILAQRAEGQGWGAIWKDLNMIGSERDAKTPPGLLKKQ
jgi:hypothetical protein